MTGTAGAPTTKHRPRRVGHVFAALSRGIRREMTEALRPIGVDVREWTTLDFLDDRPRSSNAELSRRLGVTPQAVHTVVLQLERRGLIERRPDPDHGRIARFTLTKSGIEVLRACDRAADQVEDRVLGSLSAADRRALLAGAVTALRSLEHPNADS
jgi:DNA-binding MarR family transcriptional regulator